MASMDRHLSTSSIGYCAVAGSAFRSGANISRRAAISGCALGRNNALSMGARDLPHENVNGRGSFRADRSSCVYAPTDKKIKLAVRVGASTVGAVSTNMLLRWI